MALPLEGATRAPVIERKFATANFRRGDREAEGSGLLNRRRDKILTGGSNPPSSAMIKSDFTRAHSFRRRRTSLWLAAPKGPLRAWIERWSK